MLTTVEDTLKPIVPKKAIRFASCALRSRRLLGGLIAKSTLLCSSTIASCLFSELNNGPFSFSYSVISLFTWSNSFLFLLLSAARFRDRNELDSTTFSCAETSISFTVWRKISEYLSCSVCLAKL